MKKYLDKLNQVEEFVKTIPPGNEEQAIWDFFEELARLNPYDENGNLKPGARLIIIDESLGLYKVDYDPDLEELPKEG